MCHALNAYAIKNTLTMEWDMRDNFSAGDKVEVVNNPSITPTNSAYNKLIPVRYGDIFGRADLIDFAIIRDYDFNADEVRALPENPINLEAHESDVLFGNQKNIRNYGSNNSGIVLLKDNREAISPNYNLQMVTDSDRFVLSNYLWSENKGTLHFALLIKEVNKLSNDTINQGDIWQTFPIIGYIGELTELRTNVPYGLYANISQLLSDKIRTGDDGDYFRRYVKAIAVYEYLETAVTNERKFVFARNLDGLGVNEKSQNWYIQIYKK